LWKEGIYGEGEQQKMRFLVFVVITILLLNVLPTTAANLAALTNNASTSISKEKNATDAFSSEKSDANQESRYTLSRTLKSNIWNRIDFSKWTDFAKTNDGLLELVLGLHMDSSEYSAKLNNLIKNNEGKIIERVSVESQTKALVVGVPSKSVQAFVAQLDSSNLCRYIEPNIKVQADFVPNDPLWTQQWGPQKIEADRAWDVTTGNSSVLVAVVDTGIDYTHGDIAPNYVPLGYDWVNDDNDPIDDQSHGTHCAGIIAAALNNSIGIAGIAQVKVMAEKCLNSEGWGYESDCAQAVIHAVDQGAKIISCSWGSSGDSQLIHDAVKYAWSRGVLVVAAAGNSAIPLEHYPAAYDEVVAVTATDSTDYPAFFTTYGEWVEVSAPGFDILSTVLDNDYKRKSGTSMACPHVAGVAALILSRFPNLTNTQLRQLLLYATDDLGDPGFDIYYGYGRINARKAVEQPFPEHDLALWDWDTPPYVEPYGLGLVNATLYNVGGTNESDIIVQLLANGSIVDSVTVPSMLSDSFANVTLSWTPVTKGQYNLTINIILVPGESNLVFNTKSAYVDVDYPLRISIVDSDGTIQPYLIYEVWKKLNKNWKYFGDQMIHIDYTSLRKLNFTYDDIKSSRADVLFISDPWFREYSEEEIDAITRYTYEGHGLVATGFSFGFKSDDYMVADNSGLAPLFGLNKSINWGKTDTPDNLYALDPAHPLFTNIPMPYDLSELDIWTSIPGDGSWDSNELCGGTYLALGGFNRSAIVAYRGLAFISPELEWTGYFEPAPNIYHLQLLYNAMTWSRFQRPEHELTVSVEAPALVVPAENAQINATVTNVGGINETDVKLQIIINGSAVDSHLIPDFPSGSTYLHSYLWEPTEAGAYNITTLMEPALGEDNTWNNIQSVWSRVFVPPDILIVADNENESPDPRALIRTSLREFKSALNACGQEYYVWEEKTEGRPPLSFLTRFKLVIWTIGAMGEWWPLSTGDSMALASYAKQGGKVIFESDLAAYFHTALDDADFLRYVLHATYKEWTFARQGSPGLKIVERDNLVVWGLPEEMLWGFVPATIGGVDAAYSGVAVANYLDNLHPPDIFPMVQSWGAIIVSEDDHEGSTIFYSFPFFAIPEQQRNLMMENMLNWLFPAEHELYVNVNTFKDGCHDIGVPAWINATITNWGQNNETNVQLQILINGTTTNSTIIPEISAHSSFTYSYLWKPGEKGLYNITAHVLPVPAENVLYDNVITETVRIRRLVVALISDGQELKGITSILDSMDVGYHVFSDNNYYDYSRSLAVLSMHRIVIMVKSDRLTSEQEYTALQSYLASGGKLLVTGESCLATSNPARVDSLMCDIARATCSGVYSTNLPHALYVVDGFHPIVDGLYGKFPAGYTTSTLSSYIENATADTSKNAITVAKCISQTCPADKIIATRLDAGKVVFWNGRGYQDWSMNADSKALFKNIIYWFEFGQLNDLKTFLEVPSVVEPNKPVTLKAVARNMGYHDENNVELYLFINNVSVFQITLPELTKNTSSTIKYLWVPTSEGNYNLTAYVPLVPEEENETDNVYSVFVYVDVTPPTIGAPSQSPDAESVQPYQNVTVTVEVVDAGVGVREVILSYSTTEGQTWINVTMNRVSNNTYQGDIPGFEAYSHVQYKIIAYDNFNNPSVEDNNGEYFIYIVVPEFQGYALLIIIIIATLIAAIFARENPKLSTKSNLLRKFPK
jgi:thermitase